MTLVQAQKSLAKGELSATELVSSCLARIKTVEPAVHAFMTVCAEQALAAAKRMDSESKSAREGKPLWGIPIAVKDNYSTKGVRTTASAKVLDDYMPVYDATAWKRVADAGAILIGKTNMDAWAHGSSTETSDYGASRNPWDTSRLPGGSSGGSAAAVAADEVIAALGSETAGSIRGPASWCGIVGVKPTYGRVSRYGIIAMGSSLDSPGPMTKTVEDAALLLGVMAGHDPSDATTSAKPPGNYLASLSKPLTGVRIGYSPDYFTGVDPQVTAAVEAAMHTLESLGARLIKLHLFDPKYAIAVYTIIMRSEVSSNLARYDGIRYGEPRNIFGDEAKRRIMFGTYALSAGYYDAYYLKAEKLRTLIIDDFHKAFTHVDAIVGPALPKVAMTVGSTKDDPLFGEMTDVLVEPSSIAGLTGMSVPCGFTQGLPVGMQIIGPQFAEETILPVAYAYEQATEWHTKHPAL